MNVIIWFLSLFGGDEPVNTESTCVDNVECVQPLGGGGGWPPGTPTPPGGDGTGQGNSSNNNATGG